MMRLTLRPTQWPLTAKVPLLVVALMIGVAVVIGKVVLDRLASDQQSNLRLLTNAYLDGLSTAVLPHVARRDVWETFDTLDRARGQYAGVEVRYAVVELLSGAVLASSDPQRFPVQSALPAELRQRFAGASGLDLDESSGRAWLSRKLLDGGFPVGRILAEIDITDLLKVRREVLRTLVLVNGALTLALAFIGYFSVKRMLQPLGVLARHVELVREGSVEPIADGHRKNLSSEIRKLFDEFNRMARSLSEREILASRLAEEEKYAMLGKLASGMAHEVNNPLGGMLNAIDTLHVHGDDPVVRQKSLDFLRRGLAGIRNVVRAALVTYKGGTDKMVLTPHDLDDLPFLVQHETGQRRIRLDWRNRITEPVSIDGAAVRQITLNLLLNACAASPGNGTVAVEAVHNGENIRIAIEDEGPGLPESMTVLLERSAHLAAPPQGNIGLGLWTTARLVNDLGGRIEVERRSVGTRVVVTLPVVAEKLDAAA